MPSRAVIMRRRAVLYACLALAIPLPALALTGGEPEGSGAGVTSIAVSASLDSCGTSGASIVCKIDATWDQVPGATRYAATVSRADGSVVDYGDVGAGSGSFWVPYVGNGTYTVTVSAYGTPPGEADAEVIARGSSGPANERRGTAEASVTGAEQSEDAPSESPAEEGGEDPTEEPTAEEPQEPTCEEPAREEPPSGDPAAEAPASGEEQELDANQASALDEAGEPHDPVECPERVPEP